VQASVLCSKLRSEKCGSCFKRADALEEMTEEMAEDLFDNRV
jgi:hypothetical protein